MPSASGYGAVAAGNISPRRFVKRGATAGKVLQAGAGEKVCGISQSGTRNAPYSTLNDGYAAISGENVRIFGPGEICEVQAGATFAIDARLIGDANGKAVAVAGAADGEEYGAVALAAATAADQFIPVRVEFGQVAKAGVA
jgi:hypothetical protein